MKGRFVGAIRIGARQSGARPNAAMVAELSMIADRAVSAFHHYSGLPEADVIIAVRVSLMCTHAAFWFEEPCAIRWFEDLFSGVRELWRSGKVYLPQNLKVRPVDVAYELRLLELADRLAAVPRARRSKRGPQLRLVRAAGGAA